VALGLPIAARHLAYAGSRAEVTYLVARDAGAEGAAATLRAVTRPTPAEMFALGLRSRWEGDIKGALLWLDRAGQAGVTAPELQVALGNARFLSGDAMGALAAYARASDLAPTAVVPLFNASQVRLTLASVNDGQDPRQRANELDLKRVADLTAAAQETGVAVAEPAVPRLVLADGGVIADAEARSAVASLWRGLAGPLPRLLLVLVNALGIAWTVAAGRGAEAGRWASDCRRCGDAACRRCAPGLTHGDQCVACVEAGHRDDALGQQLRIKKEIESHRYHARKLKTRRLLSWFAAGLGQLLQERALLGLLLMTAFGVCVLAACTGLGWLPEALPAYAGVPGVLAAANGLLAALLYLISGWLGRSEEV
jgi:hypothetical protein